jgi:hypothetical protein
MGYLFEHVVEKSQSGVYVALSAAVEVQFYGYVGFFRGAVDLCRALSREYNLGYTFPRHTVAPDNQSLASDILGKPAVGVSVADGHVVLGVVHIFAHKTCGWLARAGIVFGEVAVYQYVVERDTFSFKRLKNKVVYRPKSIFRKRVCAQAVLIADHYKFEIEL